MPYARFLTFSIVGGALWIFSMVALGYFVGGRSPEDVAAAIERIAATVSVERPLILMGYSFGADIAGTATRASSRPRASSSTA